MLPEEDLFLLEVCTALNIQRFFSGTTKKGAKGRKASRS